MYMDGYELHTRRIMACHNESSSMYAGEEDKINVDGARRESRLQTRQSRCRRSYKASGDKTTLDIANQTNRRREGSESAFTRTQTAPRARSSFAD